MTVEGILANLPAARANRVRRPVDPDTAAIVAKLFEVDRRESDD
ncbi:hypothetical protein FHU40_004753 [Nocardioides soli]|uniref:Uncharacterized protein n=1 Tax=Nocardioides soli TaxID=1036020 RepID=A0A7W4Z4M3_9ACTN|nr:hypothetical protein [Nocardioides soli]